MGGDEEASSASRGGEGRRRCLADVGGRFENNVPLARVRLQARQLRRKHLDWNDGLSRLTTRPPGLRRGNGGGRRARKEWRQASLPLFDF